MQLQIHKDAIAKQQFHELHEIIQIYRLHKKIDNKRVSTLKSFLRFCIKNEITVSDLSIDMYIQQINSQNIQSLKTIRSILNVFKKFCIQKNISGHWYEKKEYQYKGENPYILIFLSEYDFQNDSTKILYQDELNLFFRFLQKENLTFSLMAVQKYIQEGRQKGLSRFTLNRKISTLRVFCDFLLGNQRFQSEVQDKDDINKITRIKNYKIDRQRYYKESLSIEERENLMSLAENIEEQLILSLQSYEGLRANEVCQLKISDVDLALSRISVVSKGRHNQKKDTVLIFDYSKSILLSYLDQRLIEGQGDDHLFPGLTYQKLYKIVKKYLPKMSPHCLRHTAAQIMVEKKVDKDYVQIQLRHKDYSTTKVYTYKKEKDVFFENCPRNL